MNLPLCSKYRRLLRIGQAMRVGARDRQSAVLAMITVFIYSFWMPAIPHPPTLVLKGRGTLLNVAHRFTREDRQPFDDGWSSTDAPAPVTVPTEVRWEDIGQAITRNHSPDISFELGLNPYRGCEHGCSYCYARPSHSYLGLSPGLDFETRLIARRNIAERLRAELVRPGFVAQVLALGTVTDAYQPVERRLRLTRSVLEVLARARLPVVIVTKGSGIERDLDLLAPMAAQGLVAVYVSITTLKDALARQMEPRAAAPYRRLRTLETLAAAGIPVGVSLSPQIPFLNDDMEQVLDAAHAAGARRAFYQVLRLPWELKPLFEDWLQRCFPDRAERVMARVTELHGGKRYDPRFGLRMKGQGVWSQLLQQRFNQRCQRLGMNESAVPLTTALFSPSALHGQASLFDA